MIMILGISAITGILLFISSSPKANELQGPQCGTIMTIIYDTPSKYDKTKILNALKENLTKNNFADVEGSNPWWDYVSIRELDKDGTVKLEIPTASVQTINMTQKIVREMDGVSRILPEMKTWCY